MPLDQSFSAENFRTILDIENRKGVFLEGEFFPQAVRAIDLIKACNKDIRSLIKAKSSPSRVETLKGRVKKLKGIKERILMSSLEDVSKNVTQRSFKIQLRSVSMPSGSTIYLTDKSPENYFAMKQVQKNMYRLFQVKQSNRHLIISQLKALLADNFPKYIVRTDIEKFYESIPHEKVYELIHGNNLLSPLSKKFVRQILSEYKRITGKDVGIPRGIGISAYLAELYLRDLDNQMKELSGVTYYARYVDDIVVIFTPQSNEPSRNYCREVEEVIKSKCLTMNSSKTETIDLMTNPASHHIEYLGYKITFGNGDISLSLTNKKVEKYKLRIDAAIDDYNNLSKVDEKRARSTLVKRIRFLTGNTRLKNNKKNVLVGIYYSNSQLTDTSKLCELDNYLSDKITSKITSPTLQNRLGKYGFQQGFETKIFSPFSARDLSGIMKVWKPRVW